MENRPPQRRGQSSKGGGEKHRGIVDENIHTPGAGRNHTQLVLTDRSSLTEGRNYGVIRQRTWRLADLGAKHALLKEGWTITADSYLLE